MTGVGPILRVTAPTREKTRVEPAAGPAAAAPATDQRALVPVARVKRTTDERTPPHRTSVPFLAQLIANERQLPQTRERRRAEPHEAAAAYQAGARLSRRR